MSAIISALKWIPKGLAKEEPDVFHWTEEEYARIQSEIEAHTADAQQALAKSKQTGKTISSHDGDVKESALPPQSEEETLDEPEAEEEEDNSELIKTVQQLKLQDMQEKEEVEMEGVTLFSNVKGLTFYGGGEGEEENDPYLKMDEMSETSEKEERMILKTDSLLLLGKTEEEVSHLEVHVYDNEDHHTYVHHDILLPSFPLCVDYIHNDNETVREDGQTEGGIYAVVGTFEPTIEIWNLNVIDPVYPSLVLGKPKQEETKKSSSKKKKASTSTSGPAHHTDAVLAISPSRLLPHLMLSASADHTINLWDLAAPSLPVRTFRHHKDKVAVIEWSPTQVGIFASAAYDGRIYVIDAREEVDSEASVIAKWKVDSDTEALSWDPSAPNRLVVALENGNVKAFEVGKKAPIFTIAAHNAPCTSLKIHPTIADCWLTASVDCAAKVWDVKDGKVHCVATKKKAIGKIFSAGWHPDAPLVAALGDSEGELLLWNLAASEAIFERFKDRLPSGLTLKPGAAEEIKIRTSEQDADDEDAGEEEEEEEMEEDDESDEEMK